MKQLIAELKRRNVTRTAVAYLAAAWFTIEVADTLLPRLGFTEAAVRNVIVMLAIGFVPALVISWFFELTADGLKRESDADHSHAEDPRSGKTADRVIVALLVAAVSVLALDRFVLDPARDQAAIEEAASAARADAVLESFGDKSIAVLAFSDMSPEGDQQYLSDGIAEELLNMLSTIRELRVISRSSAFSFKGSNATMSEIAEKLGVTYILEGSVRKYDDNIRITAQLIDARADAHIWSQNYDRKLQDVFAIQDEISDSIVDRLKLTLLAESPNSVEIDAAAYEKYLQALFIVHTTNRSRLREAQALLNEVLQVAPNYVPALNALGRLYYRIPKTEGMSPEENYSEILAIANRVVEIDPDGIDALIWQGWLAYSSSEYQAAARYYERAMAIDPNNTSLLRVLVAFLDSIDRPQEAVAVGEYLLRRDPACSACVSNLARALRSTGDARKSAETLKSILDWRAPGDGFYWSLAVAWLHAGEPGKALEAAEKESLEGNREIAAIMALHDLGRIEEHEQRFERFRQSDASAEAIARIYAWTGDADKTLEWLSKMIETEGPHRVGETNSDIYSKVISDPRLQELRARHGVDNDTIRSIDFDLSLPAGVEIQ